MFQLYETHRSNRMKPFVPTVWNCPFHPYETNGFPVWNRSFLGVKLNSSYRADWFHIPVLLSDIMTVLPDGASENPCW